MQDFDIDSPTGTEAPARGPTTAFVIYLGCAALCVAAIHAVDWLVSGPLQCGPGATLKIFGKLLPCERWLRQPLMTLAGLGTAFLAEALIVGRRLHSWRRLLRPRASERFDLIGLAQEIVPYVLPLLATVLTAGLWYALNRWVQHHVPTDWKLYDRLVAAVGLPGACLGAVLYYSFFTYWSHRLMHTRILWPIHRMHHSAAPLTPLSKFRGNPAEFIVFPLVLALPMSLLDAPDTFWTTFVVVTIYHEMVVHIGHRVSWGWISRHVWCAPLNHQIHHSALPHHLHRNYSTTMPLWDRLFGSYLHEPGSCPVGVAEAPQYRHRAYPVLLVLEMLESARELAHALGLPRLRPSRDALPSRLDAPPH